MKDTTLNKENNYLLKTKDNSMKSKTNNRLLKAGVLLTITLLVAAPQAVGMFGWGQQQQPQQQPQLGQLGGLGQQQQPQQPQQQFVWGQPQQQQPAQLTQKQKQDLAKAINQNDANAIQQMIDAKTLNATTINQPLVQGSNTTPLMFVTIKENLPMIRAFIALGANPETQNNQHRSAISVAMNKQPLNIQVIAALFASCSLQTKNLIVQALSQRAQQAPQLWYFVAQLEATLQPGVLGNVARDLFLQALETGNLQAIQNLFTAEILNENNINQPIILTQNTRKYALHLLVEAAYIERVWQNETKYNNYLAIIKELLNRSAKAKVLDEKEATPLAIVLLAPTIDTEIVRTLFAKYTAEDQKEALKKLEKINKKLNGALTKLIEKLKWDQKALLEKGFEYGKKGLEYGQQLWGVGTSFGKTLSDWYNQLTGEKQAEFQPTVEMQQKYKKQQQLKAQKQQKLQQKKEQWQVLPFFGGEEETQPSFLKPKKQIKKQQQPSMFVQQQQQWPFIEEEPGQLNEGEETSNYKSPQESSEFSFTTLEDEE